MRIIGFVKRHLALNDHDEDGARVPVLATVATALEDDGLNGNVKRIRINFRVPITGLPLHADWIGE